MFEFKARVKPDWYLDGPVKVYSKEEIEAWEAQSHPEIDLALEMQKGMTLEEIRLLDNEKLFQEETGFNEIMEGMHEGGQE
jgi:hypothetical protein